jgi:hypothetical protein
MTDVGWVFDSVVSQQSLSRAASRAEKDDPRADAREVEQVDAGV